MAQKVAFVLTAARRDIAQPRVLVVLAVLITITVPCGRRRLVGLVKVEQLLPPSSFLDPCEAAERLRLGAC
jgi:hypothetical protein